MGSSRADNAAPHCTSKVMDFLRQERIKLLPHPPYSAAWLHATFFYSQNSRKHLQEKKYNSIVNLSRAVQAIVDSILQEEYYKSFESWRKRL